MKETIYLRKNCKGGRVVVTTDGGAGSSGKGSLNSLLADRYHFDVATNNWASNAGHYTELDDGTRILVQHIPSAFVNPNVLLYINAGATLDLNILKEEITKLEQLGYCIRSRLKIHPNANVITQEDIETEKRLIKSGSTFKGCGAALAGKTLRQGRKLARNYDELANYLEDMTMELNKGNLSILVEGSQGIDLDINHAEFPYCTSRQTHPTQLVADAGLPCQAVTNVIINMRTNPIRISNISAADGETCYTGNYWDAKEISWDDVAIQAGWDDPEEFKKKYGYAMTTSVTKKTRRIFEFPKKRFEYVHALCGGNLPNDRTLHYSLNFINFVDKNVEGVTTREELMTDKVKNWLQTNLYVPYSTGMISWIRTGPRHSQIVELP